MLAKGLSPLVSLLAPLMLLAACDREAPPPPPPPEVSVVTLVSQPVDYVVELPGRVQAVRTSEVRARVDGIIERRLYEEGTDVRAGDALFRIDPRPTRAAYNAALGALARAEAGAANARQVVGRYAPLVKEQAISRQEYEAAVAAQRQGEADVASARAQAERASLELGYTSVTAPISGRAGRAQVTEGALVTSGEATLLTTIEQLDPVFVNFSQSTGALLKLRQDMSARQLMSPDLSRTRVSLVLEDGSPYGPTGHVDFFDLSVDETTGTVSLRSEFPNPQRQLLPGQFVRARIDTGVTRKGLLVPQRAVKVAAEGATVMVVGANNVAAARPVRLGDLQGSSWVIEEGLKVGDRVIVDGLQRVRPGQPVRIAATPGRAPAAR